MNKDSKRIPGGNFLKWSKVNGGIILDKIAFLFPGQGSQKVGMGFDLYQEYDVVRELFDMAEEIARINLARLCFKGPMEDLTQTVNLQPALTVVNLSCLAAIQREGVEPDISAGHSLGEFSALFASEVVSAEDAFRLVIKRGELMHRESTKHLGTMHAVIGLSMDTIQSLVDEIQPDSVVLVGDLFAKGPDPHGVYGQIRRGGWRSVLGNHDMRLLRYLDGERPNDSGAGRCVEEAARTPRRCAAVSSGKASPPAPESSSIAW